MDNLEIIGYDGDAYSLLKVLTPEIVHLHFQHIQSLGLSLENKAFLNHGCIELIKSDRLSFHH